MKGRRCRAARAFEFRPDLAFDYALAHAFGRWDVERFLHEMPHSKYLMWRDYFRYLGYLRQELHAKRYKNIPPEVVGAMMAFQMNV